MSQRRDKEYFTEREATERAAAKAAQAPEARAIHLKMADHYAALRLHCEDVDDVDVINALQTPN